MGNPVAQQIMAALQARAAGAAPGGAPSAAAAGVPGGGGQLPGPGGTLGGGDVGSDFSTMMSQLRGADPGMLVRQINNIKKLMGVMSVYFMEQLPRASGEMSKVVPALNRIVAEAEKAQNVNAAVRGPGARQPIQMGAAQPTPQQNPAAMTPQGYGAMAA